MRVVVIGGGVIGCSVAHALAVRGADVHVVDMRGAGGGATQAAAGMLAPYIEGHQEVLLRLTLRSLSMYDEYVNQLSSDSGQEIEYCRSGTLQVSRSPAHTDVLVRAAGALADRQVAHTLLDGDAARAFEPSLSQDVACALFVPLHGYVHVPQLMSALERAALRRGVTFRKDKALAVDAVSDQLRVVTRGATLHANAVVVAAGCWSGQLMLGGSAPIPVKPIRGQLLEMSLSAGGPARIVWGEDCYLVPWRNGSVIVGATVEDVGFDESSTPAAIAALLDGARAVVPALGRAERRAVRVGLRPESTDELPLIGWSSTMRGVCLATGHFRNGILLAPLTAKLVADSVFATVDPELTLQRDACAPARLQL